MLNQIKKQVEELKGKKIKIIVDVGRNKTEEYMGYIEETYNSVWTFKTGFEIKSFGYNDLLIKTVIFSSLK